MKTVSASPWSLMKLSGLVVSKSKSKLQEDCGLLHTYFTGNRYTTSKKFSGHTEFFDMPLEAAVKAYEDLLDGKELTKG